MRPVALYAADCSIQNKNMMMEELGIFERKIIRKILGPIKDEQYRVRHNSEVYVYVKKITDTFRKIRKEIYHRNDN